MVATEPDAASRRQMSTRRRLTSAALELFERNGYRGTTVAQIADAADLSERSFFRYFADKDEVLFLDSTRLQEAVIRTLSAGSDNFWELTRAGLLAAAGVFELDREQYAVRERVIASHPNLQGRDQVKHLQMQATVAETLTEHGYPAPKASLIARLTVAAWVEAISRWSSGEAGTSDLTDAIDQVVDDLRELLD